MGSTFHTYVGPFALAGEEIIEHIDDFPEFWVNQFCEGELLKPRELWRGSRVVILPNIKMLERPTLFSRDDCTDAIEILGGWNDEWNLFMDKAHALRLFMERNNINHDFTWGVVPYWM